MSSFKLLEFLGHLHRFQYLLLQKTGCDLNIYQTLNNELCNHETNSLYIVTKRLKLQF